MAKVLIPETITDSMLTSSSIAEPAASGEDAYNSGTTYAIGDTVSVISTNEHNLYRSLQNSNTGNTPVPLPGESAWWLHIGKTNRWNIFDLATNYKSSGSSPVTYTITPGVRFDSFAVGAGADFAKLTVRDFASNIVFEDTKEMRYRPVVDYYDYFYMPFLIGGRENVFFQEGTQDSRSSDEASGCCHRLPCAVFGLS